MLKNSSNLQDFAGWCRMYCWANVYIHYSCITPVFCFRIFCDKSRKFSSKLIPQLVRLNKYYLLSSSMSSLWILSLCLIFTLTFKGTQLRQQLGSNFWFQREAFRSQWSPPVCPQPGWEQRQHDLGILWDTNWSSCLHLITMQPNGTL